MQSPHFADYEHQMQWEPKETSSEPIAEIIQSPLTTGEEVSGRLGRQYSARSIPPEAMVEPDVSGRLEEDH